MCAMFAMMQMFYARQDTRDFCQESYTICVDKLMRAEAAHRCLKRHVRRHRRVAWNAAKDRDATQAAMEAIQS